MKKTLLFILVLAYSTCCLSAEFNDYLLRTSFEDGKIPAGWKQENVVGNQPWVVESTDLSYPDGAYEGSYRLALRNENHSSLGFRTKLILPVLDLSQERITPILIFAHAQQQYLGDFDKLTVYYRTDTTRNWIKLKEYNEKISKWQDDTIMLVSTKISRTYQIAFEASDNTGRGVVLDDIRIRPIPTCIEPSDLKATSIRVNEATIQWTGSGEALYFRVIASTEKMAHPNPDAACVVSDVQSDDFMTTVTNLEKNTKYYIYVMSNCGNQESEWSEALEITTTNQQTIPFEEPFNKDMLTQDDVVQPDNWTCGTGILSDNGVPVYSPYLNTNISLRERQYYSVDTTTSLVFATRTNGYYWMDPIPGGTYSYAASQELDIDNIQKLEVAFWMTTFKSTSGDLAASIIVGVMDDPLKVSTFVPVDTVSNRSWYLHKRYIVSLANYTGDGKHIAFMSDFSQPNFVCVDRVTIREISASVPQIQTIGATDHSITLKFDQQEGTTYNVIFASDCVIDGAPKNILIRQDGISAASQVFESNGLLQDKAFYIYEQAVVNGKESDWSEAKVCRLPRKISSYPYTITFEQTEPTYLVSNMLVHNVYKTYSSIPADILCDYSQYFNMSILSDAQPRKQGSMSLQIYGGEYAVLPMVDDVKSLQMGFYLMKQTTTSAGAMVVVGVIENPYSMYGFQPISSFTNDGTDCKRCFVNFNEYAGQGKYIAIKAYSTCRIDMLTIDENNKCLEPSDFTTQIHATSATLSWNSNSMSKWKVWLGTQVDNDRISVDGLVTEEVVSSPTITINNLNPHTYYYYQVATICGDETIFGPVNMIVTDCAESENVPYIETFDSYKVTATSQPLPSCWVIPTCIAQADYNANEKVVYPYITSATCHTIGNALYFDRPGYEAYFVLPAMNESIQGLQLSIWARLTVSASDITIGVMTDPYDMSSFTEVSTINISTTQWNEHIIRLDSYTGNGRYIAVKKAEGQGAICIDDVVVSKLVSCGKVSSIRVENETAHGATFSWPTTGAQSYRVVVLKDNVPSTDFLTHPEKIIYEQTVTTNQIVINSDKIAPNDQFYVYVQSQCGTDEWGEWSNSQSFNTTCGTYTPEEFGTETFTNAARLRCWVTGVKQGTHGYHRLTGYLELTVALEGTEGTYAVTPELEVDDIRKWQVSFDAHSASATMRKLTVGVITNPDDLSTAQQIQTIDLENANNCSSSNLYGFRDANRYTVRLDRYLGDNDGNFGRRVIFITQNGGSRTDIYVNNIQFEPIPTTTKEPVNIIVSNVNEDGATVSWDKTGSAYEVVVTKEKSENPASVAVQTLQTATNAITLSGLDALTKYYVYVRTMNGSDYSAWSNSRKFTTLCSDILKLPYTNDFNANGASSGSLYILPDCWTGYYNGKEGTMKLDAGVGTYLITDPNDKSNVCVAIGAVSKKDKRSYVVLPAFDADLSTMMITFNYASEPTSAANEHRLFIGISETDADYAQMLAKTTWLDTIIFAGNNFKALEWYRYNGTFANYHGSGKHIVIGASIPTSAVSGTAAAVMQHSYIDNLTVEPISTCISPDKLTQTALTGTTAAFQWEDTEHSTWEVACVPAGSKVDDATIYQTNNASYTFTNLESSTTYDLYVRSKCDDGLTSSWQKITITTLCLLPLEEAYWDFEDEINIVPITENSELMIPSCWVGGSLSEAPTDYDMPRIASNYVNTEGYPGNIYAYEGKSALEMRPSSDMNANPYVVLPAIDADMDTLQLSFYARIVSGISFVADQHNDSVYNTYCSTAEYDRELQIGYLTNPADMSTFVLLEKYIAPIVNDNKIHAGDNRHWYQVKIPLCGTNNKYICLRMYQTTGAMYIDNIKIEPLTSCPHPTAFQVDKTRLTDTEATVSWICNANSWNVRLSDEHNLVKQEIINEPICHFDNLQSNTTYTLEIQSTCDEHHSSNWVKHTFKTLCSPFTREDATWGFEDNYDIVKSYYGSYETENRIPSCWIVGALGGGMTNSYESITHIQVNSERKYSRTGESALYIPYSAYNGYGCYAVMPTMDFDISNKTLHFFMRHADADFGGLFSIETGEWYHLLEVGHIVGDDISTFVCDTIVEIIKSSNISSTDKETDRADRFWDEVNIPLTKFADAEHNYRIVFMYNRNNVGRKTGNIAIDDVEITSGEYCTPPQVVVKNVTAHAVDIAWVNENNYEFQLELATDKEFNNIVYEHTSTDESIHVTGLVDATNYHARLRKHCDEFEWSEWEPTDFTTANSVRFAEDFRNLETGCPDGWTRYYIPSAEEVYQENGSSKLAQHGDDLNRCWHSLKDENPVMYKGHMIASTNAVVMAGEYFSWLVTPSLDLTEVTDPIMLTFNLALSRNNNTEPFYMQESYSDEFRIIISEDDGKTWKESNTILWSNDNPNADYVFKEIPYVYNGKQYRIDCTKYLGKTIKIAFYLASPATGSAMTLHLGNVLLNKYKIVNHDIEACQWEDINDGKHYIAAESLSIGDNTLEYYSISGNDMDTLDVYNIHVSPMTQTSLRDISCEGRYYTKYGFNMLPTESGIYKQKLQSANSCDSLVLLDLTVEKSARTVIYDTICQNSYYQLGNRKLYSTGLYIDTMSTVVNGCDSILELHLTVMEMLIAERNVYLCPSMSIEFGKYGRITNAGIYTDTIRQPSGCDSVITLYVENVPSVKDIRNAVICQGSSYSDDIFMGYKRTGSYTVPMMKTIYGCDSTITLNLYVIDGQNSLDITVYEDELPYIVNGEEILPETTAIGYYEKSITTNGCGEVLLKITVNKPTALPAVTTDQYVKLQKVIYNNNVYIIRNGKWYDVLGEPIAPQW